MNRHYRNTKAWMLLVSLPCFLAVAPGLGFAQSTGDNNAVTVGSVAYPGELSPAGLMSEEFQRITELDSDAEISFKVSVPIVERGKVIVQNVDGLPLGEDDVGNSPSQATITVPFSTTEFQRGYDLDEVSFEAAVDDTLRNLREAPSSGASTNKKSKGSSVQSGALNQLNCGGYPLGTVITVRTESCLLGNTINEYTCSINPNTHQRAWYFTSSQWIPPSTTSCFPGGN